MVEVGALEAEFAGGGSPALRRLRGYFTGIDWIFAVMGIVR
jgi:hypothetical protein